MKAAVAFLALLVLAGSLFVSEAARVPSILDTRGAIHSQVVAPVNELDPVLAEGADLELHFKNFMENFSVSYLEEEYHKRLAIFKDNVKRMAEHQKNDPTAKYGVNQFSAHTTEEFKSLLGYQGKKSGPARPVGATLPTEALPADFDWRPKGAVTPVKNQGMCGSCWAFSTTGAVEGAWFVKTGELVSLSEQELVDCDKTCDPEEADVCDSGCDGGLMENALAFVEKHGGLDAEEAYPYKGEKLNKECLENPESVAASISSFTPIPEGDEEQMKAYLVKNGPLSIAIHADQMQFYVKGVSCPYICREQLDHGMLIVGYGQEGFSPSHLHNMPYWIIKNSWGGTWGEEGYIRMCEGFGKCGLSQDAISVTA